MSLPMSRRFPLKPICCHVGKEKMTLDTRPLVRFWVHKMLGREIMSRSEVSAVEQVDSIVLEYMSVAFHKVPRLFKLWAFKIVLSIAAMSKWTEGLDAYCLICTCHVETCTYYVLTCEDADQVATVLYTKDLHRRWLTDLGIGSELRECLI